MKVIFIEELHNSMDAFWGIRMEKDGTAFFQNACTATSDAFQIENRTCEKDDIDETLAMLFFYEHFKGISDGLSSILPLPGG